ncbi:DUF817 domain-containing protein [Sphingosinicella ginsenosidimutans]|uniref:DUF817 domain-containing protein n=1 Tax=Allosphingosinicella ginsenosidimutans TaxID=1176539 RepID=A0A5C6TWZ3_9SPHN|nr:DUF817 domain-containing protein [Sphingosinicella ginsenosidimutans]TXC64451.1 DUF817 domain-containing protein [Sphingosinicella ginsenosidimutans]
MSVTPRHTRFERVRAALEAYAPPPGWRSWIYEFLLFGFKQGWACLFGALLLALLIATHFLYPADAALPRYDFLTLAALAIQVAMLRFRLETWDEAKVILAFHVAGTVMEVFKTGMGSWEYPEPSYLHIGAVPLFSGFMYASVGSYIARIWRIFDIRFTRYPPIWATIALAAAIYVNFFAHHWLPDARIALLAATLLVYGRTLFWFRPFRSYRPMPVLIGFLLVALFIWIAENIGSISHSWTYPSQREAWHMVPLAKLGSWYLLMIVSAVLVSLVQRPREMGAPEREADSLAPA